MTDDSEDEVSDSGGVAAMDESTTEEASAAAAVAKTPPKKSPPGMSLRSGRKKRRRSRDTTGLTPPDDVEKKTGRKRAKKQTDDDEEEDVDMEQAEDEEEESEEEEATKEPPAAAVAAATAAAAAAVSKPKAKRLPPVAKLRMPSEHTPGKKAAVAGNTAAAASRSTTAAAATIAAPPTSGAYSGSRRLLFGTPTTAAKDSTPASMELESILANPPAQHEPTPTGRHDALPRNLVRTASDLLLNFTTAVQEVSTNLIVPQPERLQARDEEEHEERRSLPLDQTKMWIIMLLLVQLLSSLAIPLGYNPISTVLTASSNRATELYQSFLVKPVPVEPEEPVVEEEEIVEPEVVVEPEPEEEPLENPLVPLMESLETSKISLQANNSAVAHDLNAIQESLQSRKEKLEKWDALLKEAEASVRSVFEAVSVGREVPNAQEARAVLGRLETMLETPLPLILDSTVPLWEQTPTTCQPSSPTSQDAVLTASVLKQNEDTLREMARATVRSLRRDSDSVTSWVRDHVEQVMEEHGTPQTETTRPAELKVGLTSDKLHEVISDRLEVELADQTGRVDYASLRTGASVIRSGPRATSPSLVDSLPLINRAMSNLRLRFYGHGPEAALTPTFPTDALGQCWSFEPITNVADDPTTGLYATLTVRLPKPISVTSVAVEHAPKELTKQIESAIHDFRVFGYEDDAASGTPWNLGSFQYNVDHERALQEWETATTTSDGEAIPKLQSITLAIDNNYGFDYSCLYRFRVHGDP